MIFGPDLIIVVFIVFIFWGVPIWAILDAVSRPSASFEAAGSSKTFWIALMAVFMFFFAPIAIILAIVYFASVRPKVRRYGSGF
jgi:hypothetical protein